MKLTMPPQSILIMAAPDRVWRTITASGSEQAWRGAEFVTDWQTGSPISITAILGGKRYRDKGEVLKAERPVLLQYSYWSRVSGLSDSPHHRSVITLHLRPQQAHTCLTVEQAVPPSPPRQGKGWQTDEEAGLKHWQFYWRMALAVLKHIAESAL